MSQVFSLEIEVVKKKKSAFIDSGDKDADERTVRAPGGILNGENPWPTQDAR